jgi:hypothetical protein
MEELKTSDTNFELTSKNINKDLIHFKNDILKEFTNQITKIGVEKSMKQKKKLINL